MTRSRQMPWHRSTRAERRYRRRPRLDRSFLEGGDWKGNALRLRKLVVQPGGVVPWHAHDARPANILIVEGAITEYRSSCKVPIEHKAGEVTAEFGDLAHWWKNNGEKPAVLYSADILPPMESDADAM